MLAPRHAAPLGLAALLIAASACSAPTTPDAATPHDATRDTPRDAGDGDGSRVGMDAPDATDAPDAATPTDAARADVARADAARTDAAHISCPSTFAPAFRYAMSQPSIDDVDAYLVVNPGTAGHPAPSPDSFYIQVVDMGANPMGQHIPWAVGDFTGFRPPAPVATWQRGIAADWYGSTAVQAQGGSIGLQIQTASVRARGTIERPLQTITVDRNFTAADDVRPWRGTAERLGIAVNLRVPHYATNGQGVVYTNLFALLVDTTSHVGLWYGAGLFDSRASLGLAGTVHFDDSVGSGTGLAIIQSDLYRAATLINPINSNSVRAAWSDLREFRFEVSRENFARGIAQLVAMYGARFTGSHDPADYRLDLITLNPEVALITDVPANDSWMGVELQNLRAYTGPECFDEHAYLAAYPDVARAVAAGMFTSGLDHYQQDGRFEGRNGCGVPACVFDEAVYLACNPDVAAAVARGAYTSAWEHYELHGLAEQRIACAP